MKIDWRTMIEMVWHGSTVPEAAEAVGSSWREVDLAMSEDMRGYFVDVAILANYRERELKEEIYN